MDKTRSAFGYKSELGGGVRIIFCPSYGGVVQAHINHNIVIELLALIMYKVWKFSILVSHMHSCLYYSCVKEEREILCIKFRPMLNRYMGETPMFSWFVVSNESKNINQ